jgi:SAM-dependent methyltransferase
MRGEPSKDRSAELRNLTGVPEEPLAESAPLAWVEAPRRCHVDPETGETCVDYHRVWQYMRLLGLFTATAANSEFLSATFRQYAQTGHYTRTLVSASADYSMLAHLKCAYAGTSLDATVLDRCQTSLFLNRWYASRYQLSLTTVCASVLDYEPQHPFDLVCTHNFLGLHDGVQRQRVVARWHSFLRPGGVVVTTQRVRPTSSEEQFNHFTPEEARWLRERAAAAARAHAGGIDVDADQVAAAVYAYAIRRRTYTIHTPREITALFENAGFDIEMVDEGGGPAERARDFPANRVAPDSYRMRIVARRR